MVVAVGIEALAMSSCAVRTRARVEAKGADTQLLTKEKSGKEDLQREEKPSSAALVWAFVQHAHEHELI